MKKAVQILLCALLVLTLLPGMAEQAASTLIPGTLTRNVGITGRNADGSFPANPVIDGESPTTGLPSDNEEYLPILVQIDNNLGALPHWGIADADIMYEAPIQGGGWTRLTALFSDVYPEETGPDRSARVLHVDLREEWDAVLVHFGKQEEAGSDVREAIRNYGVSAKGLDIDGIGNRYIKYFDRVGYHPAPHNVTVYVNSLREFISQKNYPFPVRPYKFADQPDYNGPEAKNVSIMHEGNADSVSSFTYDDYSKGYHRSTLKGPFIDLLQPESQMVYNNVIIQRTALTYNFSSLNPLLPNVVGQGAADIFIGGKYIAGAWARNSIKERTVFFDQTGKELELQRGKTWIILGDVSTAVSYNGAVNFIENAEPEETLLAAMPVAVEEKAAEETSEVSEYTVTAVGEETLASENDFSYRVAPGGLAIVTGYTGNETNITIPQSMGGYPVAAIGHGAFINQDALESITLPDGLYMIGDAAFKNNRGAQQIDIPASVRVIGASAFENCYALTNMVVPEGVTELKTSTFLHAKGLESITLPQSMQTIGQTALAGLEKLTALDVPSNVKTIGMGAFAANSQLTSIVLPNSVEEIGYSAFHSSANLQEVVLPVNLRNLEGGMFHNCPKLEKVVVPVTARRFDTSMLFTNSPNVQIYSFTNSAAQGLARDLKLPFVPVEPISAVELRAGDRIVNDSVVAIDLTKEDKTLQLTTSVTPQSPWSELNWKSSSPKTASVDANGLVTGYKSGVVTITASTMDGSRVSASCKVNVANLVNDVTASGDAEMMAAKSTTLKAQAFPEEADDKSVVWSSSHPDIASISKNGKVTAAKKVPAITQVTFTAEAKDGSGVKGTHVITVNPIAYGIELSVNGQQVDAKEKLGIDLLSDSPSLQLSAQVIPADALQDVVWKSNKPKVASVSEDGIVTGHEKGSATISIQTQDGSNVKAEYKVNVANLAKEVTIEGSDAVAAGRSIKLTAVVLPVETDSKRVSWISSDPAIATVDNGGKVIGKRNNAVQSVQITAQAQDGSGVLAVHQVTVHPLAEEVVILADGKEVDRKAGLTMELSDAQNTLALSASVLPADASQRIEWKSSSPATVSVDENGVLTAHKIGKVTITANTTDGSRERATVTVVVKSLATGLTITGNSSVKSGGWTRLDAVFTPEKVSDDKLVWESSDTSAATVTQKGVVNARKVREEKTTTITATAQDGSGVTATFVVTIIPD